MKMNNLIDETQTYKDNLYFKFIIHIDIHISITFSHYYVDIQLSEFINFTFPISLSDTVLRQNYTP
jgi:hypothetical protein